MSSQSESILQNNYMILQQERSEIERITRENNTLNSAYIDGNLYVSANYYNYIVYLFISIFLVFLFLRVSFTGQQNGGGGIALENNKYIGLIIVLSCIIILNAYLKINY